MLRKFLFLCFLVPVFGFTSIAGATGICHPSICPPDSDLKIWYDEGDIGAPTTNGSTAGFAFDISADYDPVYDYIQYGGMAFYFEGTADNWFIGKYAFDGGGYQWEVGHTNADGQALEWEWLWGDPLETLRTTGMLNGDFTAWLCDNDTLTLKEAFLFAKGCDNPVPEPATMLLLGSGLVVIAGFGRKKFVNKKKK